LLCLLCRPSGATMSAQAMEVRTAHVGFLHNSEVRDLLVAVVQDQHDLLEAARTTHEAANERDGGVLPAFDEHSERRRILSDPQRVMQAKVRHGLRSLSRSEPRAGPAVPHR
jgi:hypothetical protein